MGQKSYMSEFSYPASTLPAVRAGLTTPLGGVWRRLWVMGEGYTKTFPVFFFFVSLRVSDCVSQN